MSLAVPWALLLAALAIPIVVFYILKVRLRQVPVSTNMFWRQIYDEKPPRSIWQRFRHLLSLLVQLLLLALMVLAIADPWFSWEALKARRIVLVVDNSASMQADDVEPSRFDAAIGRAIEIADGLRFRDEMAIVLASARPDVVLGMSGHIPTLKESLRNIQVSENPTRLNSAIELGRQLIGEHPNGEIVVLSDGCADHDSTDVYLKSVAAIETDETDGKASDASRPKINWQIFATPAANVGVTQFQVRRSLVDMLGYEVLASVKNASNNSIECRLELSLNGATVDVIPLELEPNELWSRSLEKTSRDGGVLTAALTQIKSMEVDNEKDADQETPDLQPLASPNALAVDDTAWAILPKQEVQNVLIVTEGNLFLRKVFEANPLVSVTTVDSFPEIWPKGGLIVLHRNVPQTLPPGDVFVVDPQEDCDLWTIEDTIENPIVTEIDTKSDLMTHVRLDNVLLPEARRMVFVPDVKILAGTVSQDPVYAQLNRGLGKCLVLSVDLDKSDLAFRTTFPIMVTNALNYFVESSGELRESSATGDLVSWPLEQAKHSGKTLVLQTPAGEDKTFTTLPADVDPENKSTEDKLTLGPFKNSGIWSLGQRQTEPTQTGQSNDENSVELIANFAVNIASVRETDLRPPESLLEKSGSTITHAGMFTKPVWYYLITIAVVLFVIEWLLHQRRVLS